MCNRCFIFRCHQPAARFMWCACRTVSDFAADILAVPLSHFDTKTLYVPRSTPSKALPSASALLVHATTSIIRAKQLGFLPDAPKGQVRPTRPTQHAALVTLLTGRATNSLTSYHWRMLRQAAGSSHHSVTSVSHSERSASVWQPQIDLRACCHSKQVLTTMF